LPPLSLLTMGKFSLPHLPLQRSYNFFIAFLAIADLGVSFLN
jgi:hypothetical protein